AGRERRVGCRRVGGSLPRELGARGSNALGGATTARRRWGAPNFARERPPDPARRACRPPVWLRRDVRRGLLLVCVMGVLLLAGCAGRGPRVLRAVTAEGLLADLAARRSRWVTWSTCCSACRPRARRQDRPRSRRMRTSTA